MVETNSPLQHADIVGHGADGSLVLVVEVKSGPRVDRQWAAKLRRNLLAHGWLAPSPYFLLALPQQFYLWRQRAEPIVPEIVDPDVEIDPAPILRKYLHWTAVGADYVLSEFSLTLALDSWLTRLASHNDLSDLDDRYRNALVESGLPAALHGGRIEIAQKFEI